MVKEHPVVSGILDDIRDAVVAAVVCSQYKDTNCSTLASCS